VTFRVENILERKDILASPHFGTSEGSDLGLRFRLKGGLA